MAGTKLTEDEVAALREQIYSDPNKEYVYSLAMQYYSLIGQVTGGTYRDLREIRGGDDLARDLQSLKDKLSVGETWLPEFQVGDPANLETLRGRVENYLRYVAGLVPVYQEMISLVTAWIAARAKTVPFVASEELQKQIWQAHDEKWIHRAHVTTLYSDGEITSEKGGELYGARSVFTVAPPLLNKFELRLPLARGDCSYAILESVEVARDFRERMESLASR